MANMYRFLACSDHFVARAARGIYRSGNRISLPAPRLLTKPILWTYVTLRAVCHFALRVFLCEPILKAYCTQHGRGVRTGIYVPWVVGRGNLTLGDDVVIDGRFSVTFAARYCERPTLVIDDNCHIGNHVVFTVGKNIRVGKHCLIASEVWIFDSSGHPNAPAARLAGLPASPDMVRPVVIEDNVWIGRRCIIYPGVTIGEGSVVASGSVVMNSVPPNTLVGGNPARKMGSLFAGGSNGTPADHGVPPADGKVAATTATR
jgi:acetyltransferase-like isoleucine patch superfamily enzyme